MIQDPEKKGRGPAMMGSFHFWERDGDLPIVGYFAGFVQGVRKGADTLIVSVGEGTHIPIRYENLVKAWEADYCTQCEDGFLLRTKPLSYFWECNKCGFVLEQANEDADALRTRHFMATPKRQAAHLQDHGPQPPALS